ncbi:MAG: transketolase [Candidatus Limnocylindrales bacterium]|jgi:transketolase
MARLVEDVKALEDLARQIRIDVVKTIHQAGDGHPGPALSITDILVALYFATMRIDPQDPSWPDRDRFVLSKGHGCVALYAVLARRGFFSPDLLPSLRSLGSILQGHPDMNKTPGLDATTGSLGHGISIGLGMAIAARLQGRDYSVFVLTGDGELEEGIVWEAAISARTLDAGKLIAIVDFNHFQSGSALEANKGLLPILPKWQAFGWHCQEIDGHDIEQILEAIRIAQAETNAPSMILAHTIKGKGVPFMEGNNSWHKRVLTDADLSDALAALGGSRQ